ncbi:AMP-binding protein [Sphingobacterium hotanense]|uniref:AMP-binding protein n=1 Tax=Sphingobacterium hotanense TaxID=649196 RepID=UPI0021A8C09C|nr:class I adenylate-forming enzyme family protein [Sphingobacterium hotanense]MCT1525058.1 acyl--CoA ligase [Sphingobacterium hotanense]
MNLNNFDKQLFHIFHQHVLNSYEVHYLSSIENSWTYGEANDVIYGISRLITQSHTHEIDTVILTFRDQKKLLFSFWACVALQMNIVLAPDYSSNEDYKVFSSDSLLILSDFLDPKRSLDFDISQISETADWESGNITKIRSAYIYFFSSGTTGKSKLIKTSYFQMLKAIECITFNDIMPYSYRQKVLISIPLFHSYGISAVVEYTQGGSSIILPKQRDSISPLQILLDKTISATITAIEGVPYFYKQLAIILERVELPKIRHIGFGGDTVPPELLHILYKEIGNSSFSIRYGVTEIPSVISLNFFESLSISDTTTLGRVLPIYNVLIKDEKGNSGSRNMFGELIIDCSVAHHERCLISTNDIVERTENSLIFRGRTTFIKHRGYKINPVEIETFITNT